MKKNAVIVAGGSGTRLGGVTPKQFQIIAGRPMLWWSLKAFYEEDPTTRLIVVLPKSYIQLWNELYSSLEEGDKIDHEVTTGGSSRTESVMNGLLMVEDNMSYTAIHDAARPVVGKEMIRSAWESAAKYDATVPIIPVVSSLREKRGDGSIAVDRENYVEVQTPQVFKTSLLKSSYAKNKGKVFSDDAAVVESCGISVSVYPGSYHNLKVTNPLDLEIAELYIKHKPTDGRMAR